MNFSKFKNFLYFRKTLIKVEKKTLKKQFYSKFSAFTDFTRIQVFLIAYVFEKSFYFTCILRQICYNSEVHFEEGKLLFVKKIEFHDYFWTLSENFLDFWRKKFGRVVKTAFYACITFRGKIFFWKIYNFIISFGLWAKKFRTFGK